MKKNLIIKLSNLGKKLYPTPKSKYGFSIRKLALIFFLNHATLNSWLNGKTAPTERQVNQIFKLINGWENVYAAESAEDYDIDFKALSKKLEFKIIQLENENEILKKKLNASKQSKRNIETKLTQKIEKLRKSLEKN